MESNGLIVDGSAVYEMDLQCVKDFENNNPDSLKEIAKKLMLLNIIMQKRKL